MTLALTLLCRVIRRRIARGEELETILQDYPRLTGDERETVRKAMGQ